eukprot:479475-Amorphochlora_amoeboformis.AAC.1
MLPHSERNQKTRDEHPNILVDNIGIQMSLEVPGSSRGIFRPSRGVSDASRGVSAFHSVSREVSEGSRASRDASRASHGVSGASRGGSGASRGLSGTSDVEGDPRVEMLRVELEMERRKNGELR